MFVSLALKLSFWSLACLFSGCPLFVYSFGVCKSPVLVPDGS